MGWLVTGVALTLGLLRVAPVAQWRDDLALSRALELELHGAEGLVSASLSALAMLLPVGGRLLRAGVVSAVALSVSAFLIYRITLRLLVKEAELRTSRPVLAGSAALLAVLAPAFQLAGSAAGSATVAAALVLAALLLERVMPVGDARRWPLLGLVLALVGLESRVGCLALSLALLAGWLGRRELPPASKLAALALALVTTLGLYLVPLMAGGGLALSGVEPGRGLTTVLGKDSGLGPAVAAVWRDELGLVLLGLSGLGVLFALYSGKTRALALSLLAFILQDLLFASESSNPLEADGFVVLRLLSLVALATFGAVGLQSVSRGLLRVRLARPRTLTGVLVAIALAFVLVAVETSSYRAEARADGAAEVWTDAALGSLPPQALVLVRSTPVLLRLKASALLRGERPDVLVVPLSLLGTSSVSKRLLEREPALLPLVRDVVLGGKPGEYALSSLADARPLYLELDPNWDPRLFEHLVPGAFFLHFAPHALGRSDRRLALEGGRERFLRVLEEAQTPRLRDLATLRVLSERAAEQAITLAALGDRASAETVLEDLGRIDPEPALVRTLTERLSKARGRVDVAGLLP